MTVHRAHFNDGRTAAAHRVTVRLGARVLEIDGAGGAPLARWPYELIRATEERYADRPARLICTERVGRLTVEDSDLIEALIAHAPRLRRRLSDRRRGRILGPVAIGLTALVGTAVTALLLLAMVPALGLLAVPEPAMRAWGDSYLQAAEEAHTVCHGAPGQAALDRLAARLTAGLPESASFPVAVINAAAVNGFTLPGGRILLLRGLIDYAESPDEVAGVLAHEIGHGVERHPTRALIQQLGLTVVFAALLGGRDITAAGGDLAERFAFASYSRALESRADAQALELLSKAGIGSGGLAAFFDRVRAEENDRTPFAAFLAAHPPSAARAERARRDAAAGAAMTDADWRALRRICDGMPPPARRDQRARKVPPE